MSDEARKPPATGDEREALEAEAKKLQAKLEAEGKVLPREGQHREREDGW